MLTASSEVWHPDADRREGEPSAVIDLLLQRLVMRVREATKQGCEGHSVESRVAQDSVRIACMAMESTLEMQARDNKRLADEVQRMSREAAQLRGRVAYAENEANNKAGAAAMWEKMAREAGATFVPADTDAPLAPDTAEPTRRTA